MCASRCFSTAISVGPRASWGLKPASVRLELPVSRYSCPGRGDHEEEEEAGEQPPDARTHRRTRSLTSTVGGDGEGRGGAGRRSGSLRKPCMGPTDTHARTLSPSLFLCRARVCGRACARLVSSVRVRATSLARFCRGSWKKKKKKRIDGPLVSLRYSSSRK